MVLRLPTYRLIRDRSSNWTTGAYSAQDCCSGYERSLLSIRMQISPYLSIIRKLVILTIHLA